MYKSIKKLSRLILYGGLILCTIVFSGFSPLYPESSISENTSIQSQQLLLQNSSITYVKDLHIGSIIHDKGYGNIDFYVADKVKFSDRIVLMSTKPIDATSINYDFDALYNSLISKTMRDNIIKTQGNYSYYGYNSSGVYPEELILDAYQSSPRGFWIPSLADYTQNSGSTFQFIQQGMLQSMYPYLDCSSFRFPITDVAYYEDDYDMDENGYTPSSTFYYSRQTAKVYSTNPNIILNKVNGTGYPNTPNDYKHIKLKIILPICINPNMTVVENGDGTYNINEEAKTGKIVQQLIAGDPTANIKLADGSILVLIDNSKYAEVGGAGRGVATFVRQSKKNYTFPSYVYDKNLRDQIVADAYNEIPDINKSLFSRVGPLDYFFTRSCDYITTSLYYDGVFLYGIEMDSEDGYDSWTYMYKVGAMPPYRRISNGTLRTALIEYCIPWNSVVNDNGDGTYSLHSHNYITYYDSYTHNQTCSCGDIVNYGSHYDNDVNNYCDFCGYRMDNEGPLINSIEIIPTGWSQFKQVKLISIDKSPIKNFILYKNTKYLGVTTTDTSSLIYDNGSDYILTVSDKWDNSTNSNIFTIDTIDKNNPNPPDIILK